MKLAVEVDLLNANSINNIDTNFQRVETALQDAVSRSGATPNQMNSDFDMNSNDILNANTVDTEVLYINGQPVVPTDLGSLAPNSVGSDQIIDGAVDTAELADEAVTRPKLIDPLELNIWKNPDEFGAVGDGIVDDTVAVDAAMADAGYSGYVYLPEGKIYRVTTYNKLYGTKFIGPGQVVTNVTSGGQWQRNIYADNMIHLGHENVNRVYQYMNLGAGTSLGTAYIRIFGDSTATESYGDYSPREVTIQAFAQRGYPNIIVENYAVSGTRWDQFDPTGLITGTALFILSYGINDPANGTTLETRLAALRANMDSKLSLVRASANVGSLAIILKMPNSTSDSLNNRDERWYEKIKDIYVDMARKYDCAVFDTYAQFWNSRTAAGKWMDDPFADGRAIHPASAMNNWVWGRMIDEFFPMGAVSMYSTNILRNEGATTSSIAAATLPDAFDPGVYIYRATTGNGWPVDGFVRITKNVDQGVLQELFNYANGTTKVMVRTAYITGNTWNPWSGLAAGLTFSNGWVNFGGSYPVSSAYRSADGRVFVDGAISSGTTTAGTVFATLPVGYRPASNHQVIVYSNGGAVGILIQPSGSMSFQSAANATFTSVSGITFMGS